MSSHSQNKGKRGERDLAAFLRECGYGDARRGRQFSGDPTAPDVVGFDPRFHLEVKFVEKLNVHEALAQAIADAGLKIPLVVHKRSRGQWLATIRLDDLIRILQQRVTHDKAAIEAPAAAGRHRADRRRRPDGGGNSQGDRAT